MRKFVRIARAAAALCTAVLAGCGSQDKTVELVWYQIGDAQKDADMVLQKVNEYTAEKIGVKIRINMVGWSEYAQKMQVVINTGDRWDLAFTCSWTNDYLQNAQRGAFLALDDLLPEYGKEMYDAIDPRFWQAARVNGKIYGVPHQKEINNMPMWVFTKEYVDKYNVPYQDIHTLEDLEPWLKLIKENEPADVVPLYLMRDRSLPSHMDLIVDPVGIEYDDPNLTVRNVFDTEEMRHDLDTMRRFFLAGYVNKDAATTADDKSVKRFVSRSDGQPLAEIIWTKDMGYEVVTSTVLESKATNYSARGALTAVNKNSPNKEKAVEFLNLVNTDPYLRNLLNYGIEGVHWEKAEVSAEEKAATAGRPYVYDFKVHLIPEKMRDYQAVYWVQGQMFNTYVTDAEPLDKWAMFKDFNDAVENAPTFGFDFNIDPVSTEVAGFYNIREEFARSLYQGAVDPATTLPEMQKKLEASGLQKVIDEIQRQVNAWKQTQ